MSVGLNVDWMLCFFHQFSAGWHMTNVENSKKKLYQWIGMVKTYPEKWALGRKTLPFKRIPRKTTKPHRKTKKFTTQQNIFRYHLLCEFFGLNIFFLLLFLIIDHLLQLSFLKSFFQRPSFFCRSLFISDFTIDYYFFFLIFLSCFVISFFLFFIN